MAKISKTSKANSAQNSDLCQFENYSLIELMLLNLTDNVANYIVMREEVLEIAQAKVHISSESLFEHINQGISLKNGVEISKDPVTLPPIIPGCPPIGPITLFFKANLAWLFTSKYPSEAIQSFPPIGCIPNQFLIDKSTFKLEFDLPGAQLMQANLRAIDGENIDGFRDHDLIVFPSLSSSNTDKPYLVSLTISDADGIGAFVIHQILMFQ